MGDFICLDSDILINFLRNEEHAVNWIRENEDKNTLATTIINIFELFAGAYRARDSEKKLAAVQELASNLKILPFSFESAEEAGKQDAELEKSGEALDKRDLFIGIIALKEGFAIKTGNSRHFSRIKGLRVI